MPTNELKPCPFCGGEAVRMDLLDNPPFPDVIGTRYFGCRKCCVVSFTGMTDAEAVEAWNARTERTCNYVWDDKSHVWRCSECGGLEPVSDSVNYCCDCGAKVIGNVE